jgi:hypothetical protein
MWRSGVRWPPVWIGLEKLVGRRAIIGFETILDAVAMWVVLGRKHRLVSAIVVTTPTILPTESIRTRWMMPALGVIRWWAELSIWRVIVPIVRVSSLFKSILMPSVVIGFVYTE